MPTIFRRLLGFILLLATVGLTTCQSMVKAEPEATARAIANFDDNTVGQ
ncbi:hypothetical protein [Methylomarinum vadi]|nr:hypothetical protein [Methylomarinum vadi]